MEKIAALFAGFFLSSALTAVAAQQYLTFLPDIWRFVVVQVFCFAPRGLPELVLFCVFFSFFFSRTACDARISEEVCFPSFLRHVKNTLLGTASSRPVSLRPSLRSSA